MQKDDIDAVEALVLTHRQQENATQPPPFSPPKEQGENNATALQSEQKNDPSAQGDWGKMPVEAVEIGFNRHLDPNTFSQHQALLKQKKKR
jgi:Mg-chelatase subunit ChlI